MTPEEKYALFASRVSFFEFRKDLPEFKKPEFDYSSVLNLANEIQAQAPWRADDLAAFFMRNPRGYRVVEGLMQQFRFSDAQLTHLLFDVRRLNSTSVDEVYDYAIRNIRCDSRCQSLFLARVQEVTDKSMSLETVLDPAKFDHTAIVGWFKMAVGDYVTAGSTSSEVVSERIRNRELPDVSARLADYCLEILRLNDFLKSVNAAGFLQQKQIPTDTKGLHGKYAQMRLEEILQEGGFSDISVSLKRTEAGSALSPNIDYSAKMLLQSGKYFCTQRSVVGVKKQDGKLKKFDLIVFAEGKPKHLFEVNFYSTTGTKIGINEDEYVYLHGKLREGGIFSFHWITDGNFWLSDQGKEMYLRLVESYGDIYNLNMFAENLGRFG